jgi:AcrR family transcriptional regulator
VPIVRDPFGWSSKVPGSILVIRHVESLAPWLDGTDGQSLLLEEKQNLLMASLRADARRNRAQILAAAREVFVQQGADAPLDEVARRAGVGIATLYRRFPDRSALLRAVAMDVLERVGAEASLALRDEPDPLRALVRYMHRALDLRIAAVMPALLGHVPLNEDEEIRQARDAAVGPVLRMIQEAQQQGTLRTDVAFGDIGLMLVRLSRPLPGEFPRELDERLAHRHVELLVQGLRPAALAGSDALPGPALGLDELRGQAPEDVSGSSRANLP